MIRLSDELRAAQHYVVEVADLMVKQSVDPDLLIYRCHGCGRLRSRKRGAPWSQMYCTRVCQQQAYRWRKEEAHARHHTEE